MPPLESHFCVYQSVFKFEPRAHDYLLLLWFCATISRFESRRDGKRIKSAGASFFCTSQAESAIKIRRSVIHAHCAFSSLVRHTAGIRPGVTHFYNAATQWQTNSGIRTFLSLFTCNTNTIKQIYIYINEIRTF